MQRFSATLLSDIVNHNIFDEFNVSLFTSHNETIKYFVRF